MDYETKSELELPDVGDQKYCEHPSTEIIGLTYQKDDGPRREWENGDPPPIELLEGIARGDTVAGHNVRFERLVTNIVAERMGLGWPKIAIEQCDCTMIRSMALALPASLDDCGVVLRLTEQKDKEGHALMKKMCKPRKPRKHEDKNIVYWIDDDLSLARLQKYRSQDVATEYAAGKKLPYLSKAERALWCLDQVINDRGVAIDLKSARKLMAIAKIVIAKADARIAVLTRGAVTACTQATALLKFVHSRGIHCESVAKDEIDEILANARWCGDDVLIEVLELRKEFAKASTAKIKTMLLWACQDGRAHGMLQFLGAAITGRWAGRGPQPQNLPRVDPDEDLPRVERVFAILEECKNNVVLAADRIRDEVGEVLPLISKCLRGLLIAAPGRRLVGGDLSNIENRGAAWLSGAEDTLEMFRKVDAGLLPDVYILAYSGAFGVPVDKVSKEQRGLGKVIVLACGFQGSIGAFVKFANEKLLVSIVGTVKAAVSTEVWDAAWAKFKSRRDRCDLTQAQWTAIKITVDAWRRANPKIVQGWWDLQDAAIEAVENPGRAVPVYGGKVVYKFERSFLWCRLPSGRPLAYFNPAIAMSGDEVIVCEDGKVREVDLVGPDELERLEAAGVASYETNLKKKVEFEGYAQRKKGGGKVWVKRVPGSKGNLSLYGGRQLENIDQAMCRDIMAHGMALAEKAGLPIILTVHDELVAEVPEDRDDLNEDLLKKCMTTNPRWLPGFPLAAKCWSDKRYVK